mgnify:CR=1 FL=1
MTLHQKYSGVKTDGSRVDPRAQYFVLRIDTDLAAQVAMLAYADAIEGENRKFADQIRAWVAAYEIRA